MVTLGLLLKDRDPAEARRWFERGRRCRPAALTATHGWAAESVHVDRQLNTATGAPREQEVIVQRS